jgi:hypothetical protein
MYATMVCVVCGTWLACETLETHGLRYPCGIQVAAGPDGRGGGECGDQGTRSCGRGGRLGHGLGDREGMQNKLSVLRQ